MSESSGYQGKSKKQNPINFYDEIKRFFGESPSQGKLSDISKILITVGIIFIGLVVIGLVITARNNRNDWKSLSTLTQPVVSEAQTQQIVPSEPMSTPSTELSNEPVAETINEQMKIDIVWKYLWNWWFTVKIQTNLPNSILRFTVNSEYIQIECGTESCVDNYKEYPLILTPENRNYMPQGDDRNRDIWNNYWEIQTNGSGDGETSFYLYTQETLRHNFSEIDKLRFDESDAKSELGTLLNARKALETDKKITIKFSPDATNMVLPSMCTNNNGVVSCNIDIFTNNKKNTIKTSTYETPSNVDVQTNKIGQYNWLKSKYDEMEAQWGKWLSLYKAEWVPAWWDFELAMQYWWIINDITNIRHEIDAYNVEDQGLNDFKEDIRLYWVEIASVSPAWYKNGQEDHKKLIKEAYDRVQSFIKSWR